jgi:hypothetical protein
MILRGFATIMVLAASQPALAQEHDHAEITNPSWRITPDATSSDYPEFAMLVALSGKVSVMCRGSATGQIVSCKVADEHPAGLGFGEAAIRIARRGWLNPRLADGTATPSEVTFPIPFSVAPYPSDTVPPPWSGPAPSEAAVSAGRLVVARGKVPSGRSSAGQAPRADQVDPDRRAIVQSWIDELLPTDQERDETMAIAFARVVSEERLAAWAANPEPPSRSELPSPEALFNAMGGLPNDASAIAELRRRYCARYDCGTGR